MTLVPPDKPLPDNPKRPENEERHAGIAADVPPTLISLVTGAEAPIARLLESLASDPSEVTAFTMRHWTTSFLLL